MSRAVETGPVAHAQPGRLRVAIFSDAVPERNGAGAYYEDLAAQLGPKLGALTLFQPMVKKRFLRFALPLPGDPTQKLITPNVVRIRREFHALRPHLVISVTPGPFGLLGLWLARRRGVGFLTAFHTHFEGLVTLYGNTWFFRLAHWYLEQVNRILCRNSDSVLVNNADLNTIVERLGARRVDVMGTPLSRVFLDTPVVPPAEGLRQVLFAGRLAPEKNIPAILDAVKALPDIRFVIAGDGPLRGELEHEAQSLPNLRLTGWLERDALRAEMDTADLLILPSHMETFGTVALEAMARGRPALVAANAGIHHWPLLSDSLFTLGKGESLAETLGQLTRLPAQTWQDKATAARRAAETLNNRTIDQWLDFAERYARREPA